MKKSRILLAIIVILIIIVWGFLSGNMTLKLSRTKTDKVGQSSSEAQTETGVEDSNGKIIIEETEAGIEDDIQPDKQVVYYPTEEALIEAEAKEALDYFIVRGNNTLLFFREEDTGRIGSFYALAFVIGEDGYYYSQNVVRVKNPSGQSIEVNQGEYYIYFFVENGDIVEDNLEGDFQRFSVDDGVELWARYIDCPIQEYGLYINGELMDLSAAYNLEDKGSEDMPFYTLEDYILALEFGEKYLTAEGNRTVLFAKEEGSGDEPLKLHITYAAAVKNGNAYYDRGNDIEDIKITKSDIVIKISGEYYMLYIRTPDDGIEISDNRESPFQEMEVSQNAIIGLKYIDCPIEEYEYYLNGGRLDLSKAYE